MYVADYKNENLDLQIQFEVIHLIQNSSDSKLISISSMCCILYVLNNCLLINLSYSPCLNIANSVSSLFMKQFTPNNRLTSGVKKIFMIQIVLAFNRGVVYNGLRFSQIIIINSKKTIHIKNTIWRHQRVIDHQYRVLLLQEILSLVSLCVIPYSSKTTFSSSIAPSNCLSTSHGLRSPKELDSNCSRSFDFWLFELEKSLRLQKRNNCYMAGYELNWFFK